MSRPDGWELAFGAADLMNEFHKVVSMVIPEAILEVSILRSPMRLKPRTMWAVHLEPAGAPAAPAAARGDIAQICCQFTLSPENLHFQGDSGLHLKRAAG